MKAMFSRLMNGVKLGRLSIELFFTNEDFFRLPIVVLLFSGLFIVLFMFLSFVFAVLGCNVASYLFSLKVGRPTLMIILEYGSYAFVNSGMFIFFAAIAYHFLLILQKNKVKKLNSIYYVITQMGLVFKWLFFVITIRLFFLIVVGFFIKIIYDTPFDLLVSGFFENLKIIHGPVLYLFYTINIFATHFIISKEYGIVRSYVFALRLIGKTFIELLGTGSVFFVLHSLYLTIHFLDKLFTQAATPGLYKLLTQAVTTGSVNLFFKFFYYLILLVLLGVLSLMLFFLQVSVVWIAVTIIYACSKNKSMHFDSLKVPFTSFQIPFLTSMEARLLLPESSETPTTNFEN